MVLSAFSLLVMGCPDPNAHFLTDPRYSVYIYYKNSKGENLLDPSTVGHYNASDVRVNGNSSDFSIDSARYNSKLPKGYALSFIPINDGKNVGLDIITLSSTIIDTLSSKYSGTTLISCAYNRVNVLPANLNSTVFPVVIVK